MPFDINDPIQVGTDKEKELVPYITDWVSNAASIISHILPEETTQETNAENASDTSEMRQSDAGESESAETAPLDVEE